MAILVQAYSTFVIQSCMQLCAVVLYTNLNDSISDGYLQ